MVRFFQERKYDCNVKLLDGEEFHLEVTKSTLSRDVMDLVCKHICLEETDFFGLKYVCAKDRQLSWLDNAKSLGKQIGNGPYNLVFRVKFYPPNPASLQEDITRYQLVLQLREDLLKERLICAVPIYALLASYVIQAEKGDYDAIQHGPKYLDGLQFMPNQADDFLERVTEFHKKHNGITPADCDFHYLDNARKIPHFGMDFHDAFDGDHTNVILGVSEGGVHVIQKGRMISKFAWSNIHKVYFKSKRFFIDIRVVSETEYEDLTVGFKCRTRTELKRLYRSAVDHHTFFRRDAAVIGIQKVAFFKLGSKFRYSGRRTFQQLKSRSSTRVAPNFERVSSVRLSMANSGRKARGNGEKHVETKAVDEEPENQAVTNPTDSKEGDAERRSIYDNSPSISRDLLVVPTDAEDAKKEQKSETDLQATVSIKICPPTPKPSPAVEHKTSTTVQEDQPIEKMDENTDPVASQPDVDVKPDENETATETRIVQQETTTSSNSHTTEQVHSEHITTTTILTTTTTTEIITIDDETEEIVVVEEESHTTTDHDVIVPSDFTIMCGEIGISKYGAIGDIRP
eukprot:gene11785-13005_t